MHCTPLQVGPGFNRDYWARLERFVQDLATTCDDVWVVTGPLYLPVRAPAGVGAPPGAPAGASVAGYVMQHPMIGECVHSGKGRWAGGWEFACLLLVMLDACWMQSNRLPLQVANS